MQHHRQRQRGDGEEDAAQPQRQIAHAEADQAGDGAADDDQNRQRHRKDRVHDARQEIGRQVVDLLTDGVQEHRGVGADGEKTGGAEIHIAAIAAENIPGGRQHDILQHGVAGEKQIIVADIAERQIERRADRRDDEDEDRCAHGLASQNPDGRTAKVSSRMPNATAGAQDGP